MKLIKFTYKSIKNIRIKILLVWKNIFFSLAIFLYKIFHKPNNVLPNDACILYVGPKFYGNYHNDKSTNVYQFLNPLQSYILNLESNITLSVWHPEENLSMFSVFKFLNLVNVIKPKAIIFDSIDFKSTKFNNFPVNIFIYVQKKNKIDFIEPGWDTVSANYWKNIQLSKLSRKVVIFDNPAKIFVPPSLIKSKQAEVFVPPFDLSYSKKVLKPRNFDINFIGSVGSYRNYRSKYIESLKDLKIKQYLDGTKDRSQQISRVEYLNILSNSKISINFAQTHSNEYQLKGRIFEIFICGSMLLEQSNTQITQFFKEGTHFVSFDNEQDLLEKILYYLKHETKRIKIASAGQEKAVKLIANYDIFKYLKVNYG